MQVPIVDTHFMHDIFALGKYAGLIFTKLDLPQPPSVDMQKLLQWMNAAHRKLLQAQKASTWRRTTIY